MDQEVTRNNLEKRLKKAALAWACTFTPPTAFVTLEGETEESLEEKLRRGRCEGTFYKWSDDKETSDPSVVKNNMDQEVTRNNSEKRLKEAGLAWACTLTPPTACATPNLEDEMEETLEEKLRRGRRKGTFYKWSDDEETSDPLVVKNNMDQEVTRNDLEKCLKKAALAWACTLAPPTAFMTPNLEGETEESLEEKLRRGRREGTFYKWSDDKETSEYNPSKED